MKKLLLATVVATLSISAAQAAPTVYGKAFLTLDYKDMSGNVNAIDNAINQRVTNKAYQPEEYPDGTQLNSTGSKIGLKGAEALTANTDLVYQLEYGVKVDDGNATQFKSRDTYLGLSNKQYGTLLAGRLTAIDDMVNYANVTAGGVLGGDDVMATVTAPRANNAMAYVSPTYSGLNLLGMYVMDEGANSATSDLGVTNDIWGVGAQYQPAGQPYRAGVTYMQSGDFKDVRVSGAFDVNNRTTLGALYQNTDFGVGSKENAYTLSGSYKTLTPWTVYGQVDAVTDAGGTNNFDKQRYVVGGKYAFNAATTGHIYGAYLNADKAPATVTVNNTKYDARADYDGWGIGTGIEYKF